MRNAENAVEWREDVRGLHCPVPVTRCRATLAQMAVGDVLNLRASDRDAPREIEALIASLGHQMLALHDCKDGVEFVIRKRLSAGSATPAHSASGRPLDWSNLALASLHGSILSEV